MTNVVISFDLDNTREKQDYDAAYDVLAKYGFARTTPNGWRLPDTTVMGPINDPMAVVALKDTIWRALVSAGITPSIIFAGVLTGDVWAVGGRN